MTTTTSFFDKKRFYGLSGQFLKQNRALMGFLALVYFIFFSLQYVIQIFMNNTYYDAATNATYLLNGPSNIYAPVSLVLVPMIACIVALVLPVVQLNYMHNKRAVDVYHALPVSRGTMLCAHIAAAFATAMIPLLLNYAVILVAGFGRGLSRNFVFMPAAILGDALMWGAITFTIMAIVTFVAVQVGSAFNTFVLGLEFIFAGSALYLTVTLLCEQYLLGWNGRDVGLRALVLSPVTAMARYLAASWNDPSGQFWDILLPICLWFIIGAGLFYASMLLYRRRKSEVAEQHTATGVVAMIAKLVAVLTCGPLVGLIFPAISQRDWVTMAIGTCIGAILIYLFVELLLAHSFKGIKKSLPFGAVCVVLSTLMVVVIGNGAFGYSTRVPAQADIASVTVQYRGRYSGIAELSAESRREYFTYDSAESMETGRPHYYYDLVNHVVLSSPEAVELLRDVHLTLVTAGSRENLSGSTFQLQYTLKDGRTLTRTYQGQNAESIALLAKLDGMAEFKEKVHPIFRLTPEDFSDLWLVDAYGFSEGAKSLSAADKDKLLVAMRKDLLAEPIDKVIDGTAKTMGVVWLQVSPGSDEEKLTENAFRSAYVVVTDDYTNTLAALQSMGLVFHNDPSVITGAQLVPSYDMYAYGQSTFYTPTLESMAPDTLGAVPAPYYEKGYYVTEGIVQLNAADARQAAAVAKYQVYISDRSGEIHEVPPYALCYFVAGDKTCVFPVVVNLADLPLDIRQDITQQMQGLG